MLEKCYVDEGFEPENTYVFDKSGFPPEASHTQRVIGRRGTKVQHKQGSANHENVTVLITICADSSMLQLLIIFKSQ